MVLVCVGLSKRRGRAPTRDSLVLRVISYNFAASDVTYVAVSYRQLIYFFNYNKVLKLNIIRDFLWN